MHGVLDFTNNLVHPLLAALIGFDLSRIVTSFILDRRKKIHGGED